MSDTPRIVIGDLGISKTVYSNDYYAVSPTLTLPVRWMAPELLLNSGQRTTKSDVVRQVALPVLQTRVTLFWWQVSLHVTCFALKLLRKHKLKSLFIDRQHTEVKMNLCNSHLQFTF